MNSNNKVSTKKVSSKNSKEKCTAKVVYTPLKDLRFKQTQNKTIKVKVLKVWRYESKKTGEVWSLEAHAIDEEVNVIGRLHCISNIVIKKVEEHDGTKDVNMREIYITNDDGDSQSFHYTSIKSIVNLDCEQVQQFRIRIKDNTEYADLTIFGFNVEKMLKYTAAEHVAYAECCEKMGEPEKATQVFDRLIGEKFGFKLKMTEDNIEKQSDSYTVLKIHTMQKGKRLRRMVIEKEDDEDAEKDDEMEEYLYEEEYDEDENAMVEKSKTTTEQKTKRLRRMVVEKEDDEMEGDLDEEEDDEDENNENVMVKKSKTTTEKKIKSLRRMLLEDDENIDEKQDDEDEKEGAGDENRDEGDEDE
ncbi:general transcription factor IIF subunit 1-like [Papaver somniferum]|uniref:general transcription factor IIF subunit 1-like n=1 Tax=Papaver somniferum TaxID=3469 RepID=UPI000E7049A7|nr:general transcription factor IIF subunit 1-like [Papaver somniferum]